MSKDYRRERHACASRAAFILPGMTNPNPESGDVKQNEIIEEGMQGADGNVDANGLQPDMTDQEKQEKLDELKENLGQ